MSPYRAAFFFGIAVAAAAGCTGFYDQSWKPSFKQNVIGRELIAMEVTQVRVIGADLHRRFEPTTTPTVSAGTRLKVTRALHSPSFFLASDANLVLGRVVGSESLGEVWIGGYRLDPTRLDGIIGPFLLVPRRPPAWLDLTVSPPSAAAADIPTLRTAAMDEADDAVPAFAGRELIKRAIDESHPDHVAAQAAIRDLLSEGEPYRSIGRLNRATLTLQRREIDEYVGLLRATTQAAAQRARE